MEIKIFQAGPLSANNYLLTDNNESVLIDCSEYKPDMLEGVKLKYILLTHGHFDHILGVNQTREVTGAKVLMNKKDIEQLDENFNIMGSFGLFMGKKPVIDQYIDDNDIINFGTQKVQVISTPGHTQGSVSYLADNKLFSGDTLFRESCGRCDLLGGNYAQIKESIMTKLFKLNNKILVYPGHDRCTTIGYEKQHNEVVRLGQ